MREGLVLVLGNEGEGGGCVWVEGVGLEGWCGSGQVMGTGLGDGLRHAWCD